MNLYALTVAKNEANRYLEPMLRNLMNVVDAHFIYDDQSTDATREIALGLGCDVIVRPDGVPSFEECEGLFRQNAWWAFERTIQPEFGDYVLVIDADEFLAVHPTTVMYGQYQFNLNGVMRGRPINLNIPEVFGFDEDQTPLVRVDRLWGTIHAPRLFPYRQGGTWPETHYGVVAVPHYVMGQSWDTTEELALIHFGYANSDDWQKKYDRYLGGGGHSNDHVNSILAPNKTLVRLEGYQARIEWKALAL
jgi:Glycosyl transferase family 2